MELFENKRRYEWLSSSYRGSVDTYLAEDETNIYFESGRMISKEKFGIELVQIDEEVFQKKYKVELFNPEPIPQFNINLGNPEPPTEIKSIEKKIEEQNPIKIILDKQKKREKISIPVNFEFEMPSEKVIQFLDVMFDREEIIDEIIKSSTEKIDTQSIIEKIKETIKYRVQTFFDDSEKD